MALLYFFVSSIALIITWRRFKEKIKEYSERIKMLTLPTNARKIRQNIVLDTPVEMRVLKYMMSHRPVENDKKLIKRLTRNIGNDAYVSIQDVLGLAYCERCNGPINYKILVGGNVHDANTCDYCGGTLFKDFVLYFPCGVEDEIVSIENNIDRLILREENR